MAFFSIVPTTIDFTSGDYQIREGATFLVVLTIQDALGNPLNMSEWVAVAPACMFKNLFADDAGVVTNCPQPTMTWLNGGVGGEMSLEITAAATVTGTVKSGRYDIEITHSSGKIARPFMGQWAVDKEVTR